MCIHLSMYNTFCFPDVYNMSTHTYIYTRAIQSGQEGDLKERPKIIQNRIKLHFLLSYFFLKK